MNKKDILLKLFWIKNKLIFWLIYKENSSKESKKTFFLQNDLKNQINLLNKLLLMKFALRSHTNH